MCIFNIDLFPLILHSGNFLGMCGVANPIGFDETNANMPISMLLHGWQWEEDKVLRVSKTIEEMLWDEAGRRKPDDFIELLLD